MPVFACLWPVLWGCSLWDFQSQAWRREEAVRPEGRHVTPEGRHVTPTAWPGMELVVGGDAESGLVKEGVVGTVVEALI